MQKMTKKATVAVMVVGLVLAISTLAMAQTVTIRIRVQRQVSTIPVGGVQVAGSTLPSLPPFPGIDVGDFQSGYANGGSPQPFGGGISSSIYLVPGAGMAPNGYVNAVLGSSFPLNISQIDTMNWTKVQVAEYLPAGYWTVFDFSGYFPTGSKALNWYADSTGTHIVITWVDNNHNGLADPGEISIPWLTVNVQSNIVPWGGSQDNSWGPAPKPPLSPNGPRTPAAGQ